MKILFTILMFFMMSSLGAVAQDYSQEIKRVEVLGQLIVEHDNAGWVTTDKFLELSDNGKGIDNLKGWLSYKRDKNYNTVFIANSDGAPKVVFESTSVNREVVSANMLEKYREVSQSEQNLWQARETVLSQISSLEICQQFLPMNSVIFPIPEDAEGRLYMYLMSSSKTWGEIVLGKHYRFTLSKDGKNLLETRSFTNSCFSLNFPKMEDGSTLTGLTATHLNALYPEEHHVFATLSHNFKALPEGVALYVGTQPDRVWKIREGRIEQIETD